MTDKQRKSKEAEVKWLNAMLILEAAKSNEYEIRIIFMKAREQELLEELVPKEATP